MPVILLAGDMARGDPALGVLGRYALCGVALVLVVALIDRRFTSQRAG